MPELRSVGEKIHWSLQVWSRFGVEMVYWCISVVMKEQFSSQAARILILSRLILIHSISENLIHSVSANLVSLLACCSWVVFCVFNFMKCGTVFFEVTLVTVFWGYIFMPRLSFVIALSCEKVILICVAMVGFISCQAWQCQAEFGFSFIQWNWIQFIVHKRLPRGCHLAFFDNIYFSQWQH